MDADVLEHSGVGFEVKRAPTGWFVVVTCPNGARVEMHDFQSEAGAKAWIKVNARTWTLTYLSPLEFPSVLPH